MQIQHVADAKADARRQDNPLRKIINKGAYMNDVDFKNGPLSRHLPQQALRFSVKLWFIIAALGHWIFVAYILAVFYPPIVEHGMEGLKGSHLPSGFIEGDTFGNLAAIAHVLLAAIIIGGGPLQLIPAIRNRFPRFHHWLGRSYLLAAVSSAMGGLYMTWARSPIGDVYTSIGISGDGILIIVFAAFTVYHAIGRRIELHRRWALRLFMAASAVWFYRVGLMGWVMLTGGAGIDWESFTGPYLYFLSYAQYLLPLAMLEWYFYCQRKSTSAMLVTFSVVLFLLTVFMALGIFAATIGMWLPKM